MMLISAAAAMGSNGIGGAMVAMVAMVAVAAVAASRELWQRSAAGSLTMRAGTNASTEADKGTFCAGRIVTLGGISGKPMPEHV